jgi:membrane protease subunit (stomatin/prohibitin family)
MTLIRQQKQQNEENAQNQPSQNTKQNQQIAPRATLFNYCNNSGTRNRIVCLFFIQIYLYNFRALPRLLHRLEVAALFHRLPMNLWRPQIQRQFDETIPTVHFWYHSRMVE